MMHSVCVVCRWHVSGLAQARFCVKGPFPKCHPHYGEHESIDGLGQQWVKQLWHECDEYASVQAVNFDMLWLFILRNSEVPHGGPYPPGHPENPETWIKILLLYGIMEAKLSHQVWGSGSEVTRTGWPLELRSRRLGMQWGCFLLALVGLWFRRAVPCQDKVPSSCASDSASGTLCASRFRLLH